MTTQNNKLKLNIKLTVYIFLAVALVFTGIRSYLLCTSYEITVHRFETGAVLPEILNYLLFAYVCISLLLFAAVKKNSLPNTLGKTNIVTSFFAAITGVFSIASGIYSINSTILNNASTSNQTAFATRDIPINKALLFGKIQAVLSIAVFIYFIFTAFSKEKHTKIKTIFGIFSIVWHVMFIMAIYFDMNTPLNAPVKVLFQFACMASMFYIIYEIRFLTGIGKPRLYVPVSLIAVTFLCISSTSMLAGKLCGTVTVGILDTLLCLQQLAAAGYILARLVTYIKDTNKVPMFEKEEPKAQSDNTEESLKATEITEEKI
ncbi:MAG: hypothetical protein IKU52_06995 [Clostridia bacterium]|nr:hypothetical protein [Clostridia bacterium]